MAIFNVWLPFWLRCCHLWYFAWTPLNTLWFWGKLVLVSKKFGKILKIKHDDEYFYSMPVKMAGVSSKAVWNCRFFIGVRTGGAREAAAPPNFGQLKFFGQQEKIWAKPVFKDISTFFLLFWRDKYFLYNPVTFTRDSDCIPRDEFLVIREGYHKLIYTGCFKSLSRL